MAITLNPYWRQKAVVHVENKRLKNLRFAITFSIFIRESLLKETLIKKRQQKHFSQRSDLRYADDTILLVDTTADS